MRTLSLLILVLALGAGCTTCAPPELVEPPAAVEPAAPPAPLAPSYGFDQTFFDLMITRLKERCQLNDEVIVFLQDSDSYWGATWWTPETMFAQQGYKIQLNPQQSFHGVLRTLIHEWAHAMVWDAQPDGSEPHDALWGVAWARAYRTLVDAWDESTEETAVEQCSLVQ